jgi:glycine cleavage system H lipoate-binding protein
MKNNEKYYSIPVGEVKCIWMTAGIVNYKLCDKKYDCDNCGFYFTAKDDPSVYERIYPSVSRNNAPELKSNDYRDRILSFLDDWSIDEKCQYYPGHIWVKMKDENTALVGIDSLFGKILPKTKNIVEPLIGNILKQDQPGCWVTSNDITFTLKSPLSGIVDKVNENLFLESDLISQDPFGKGWLFSLKPTNFDIERKKLINAEKMKFNTERDVLKLKKKLLSVIEPHNEEIGETMMDGGQALSDIYIIIGKKNYQNIIISLFS